MAVEGFAVVGQGIGRSRSMAGSDRCKHHIQDTSVQRQLLENNLCCQLHKARVEVQVQLEQPRCQAATDCPSLRSTSARSVTPSRMHDEKSTKSQKERVNILVAGSCVVGSHKASAYAAGVGTVAPDAQLGCFCLQRRVNLAAAGIAAPCWAEALGFGASGSSD